MSERTLKEIALDLLEQYKDAKETVIWEYSGSIDEDIKRLEAEVEKTRQEVECAEPEDSIPISWIEKEIDWLNNTDNCFAKLTATNISAMVKRWKEKKDE